MHRTIFRERRNHFQPWKKASAAGMCALLLGGQTAPLLGNPTGGAVVAGAANIGAAGPTLTVNQSTQSAIINWQTFSIANGETTKFIVPNSGAATLNRVAAGNPSAIYGNLQSNGILYLVNPSGIVVGPNGRIDTAGFMASTLDVSNQQFLAGGDLNFAGASDASINNAGKIHASIGDVYLIANQVNNTGSISAPKGTVGLAAGSDILLQQAGNQHLFVQATPTGAKRATGVTNSGTIRAAAAELKAAGGNAYALAINNTGVIAATGYKKVNGQVYLTSDGGSISNSGKISAKQHGGNGGTIALTGTSSTSKSSANTVTNSGTLDVSATRAGGTGGTVAVKNMTGTTLNTGNILARGGKDGQGGDAEISGEQLSFGGKVDTTSEGGTTGWLLLDPNTFTVAASGGDETGAQVGSSLATSNVTLSAEQTLTIDDNITWSSGNTLTLQTTATGSTIAINAAITGTNGGLTIAGANNGTVVTPSAAGAINVASFILQNQTAWNQLGTLASFVASQDFEIQNNSTFLRATGGTGGASTPYILTDIYGLQGMASPGFTSADFDLANNVDATSTSSWNGGAGFKQIGTYDYSDSSDANSFSGTLNGQSHTINGLTINLPTNVNGTGFFGDTATSATVENLNFTNAHITGETYVGGLAGVDNATVNNVTFAGTVTGTTYVGGLAGISAASISNSATLGTVTGNSGGSDVGGLIGYIQNGSVAGSTSSANVSGPGSNIGGLVGEDGGQITTSSMTGTVTGTGSTSQNVGGLVGINEDLIANSSSSATVSGYNNMGGLVGNNRGTIELSISTGTVTGENNFDGVGGLVGYNSAGTIIESYSTASVSAVSTGNYLGGFVGVNSNAINDSYSTGPVTGNSGVYDVGGFAGLNSTTIHNAYSTGLVTGNGATNVGGFAGESPTAVQNGFFDTDSSGQTFAIGSNSADTTVTAATTAQLKTQAFITAHAPTAPTFDFSSVWTTEGDTLTPQINGLPQTALPGGSAQLDMISGTAYLDQGTTFSSGVLIELLSGGSVLGSTTTNGSGGFTFSLSSAALVNGILLTDATDKGNTFYKAASPATTTSGIDLWGSTIRVTGDAASNAALASAVGSQALVANGIQYSVSGGALTTTAGENFSIYNAYDVEGNVTARGTFLTDAASTLTGSAAVTLTGGDVSMAGTFNRAGALTVASTTGAVVMQGVGTTQNPATALGLTVNSAQAVNIASSFLSLGTGGFAATGTGYTSTVDANGEANGVNLFDDSITSAGAISLTGTAGYTFNSNGGLAAGQGVFIGTDGARASLLSATGSANLSITGTFNSNITTSSLLSGVILVNDVGDASNTVSVANGRLTITGTVSQGTTTASSHGVDIEAGPAVEATGTGSVTITGTESATSALDRVGVYDAGSSVSVVDGAMTIGGTVTRGTASSSIGVNLYQAANVAATGAGSVTVTGNSTGSTATFNAGVDIDDATLSSSGTSGLAVNGNAGTVTGATDVMVNGSLYNPTSAGVHLTNGSSLSATNAGSVRLTGVAGPNDSTAPIDSYGSDTGVRFDPFASSQITVTSAGGGIAITGTAGSGAGSFFNVGVNVATATVQDTGNGAVTITGTGGAGQDENAGVTINGATTKIEAGYGEGSGGVLTIIGHGAAGVTGAQNDGVSIFNSAQLVSGNAGIVLIGSAATGSATPSSGVIVTGASITTANGPLTMNSTGGNLSVDGTIMALTSTYIAPVGTTSNLTNLGNPVSLNGGNFTVTQSGDLVLDTTTVQSLTLDVTGTITQVGRVASGQLAITNATSVTLNDTSNVISSLGVVNSGEGFNFFTDPGLTLTNTVTSAGPITIAETGGPLTLAAGGQVIETGTATITLAAGTNLANSNYFINDSSSGANAVQTGSFGRFFLFSSDPTYDSLGGITFAPANMVYNAVYPTSASNFTGSGNAAFFYVAGSGQVGPNNPNAGPTAPNTMSGGAAGAGSNIVPPVLVTQTSQVLPQTQGDGTTGSPTNFLPNGGTNPDGTQPPPFSFTGTGVSQLLGQLDGGLANSASNSGQVGSGDIAQLNNGQYSNVSNPKAANVLNEALGPIVYSNMADALRSLGDWADVPDSASDTASSSDGETILTVGDVAEMTGTKVKAIPLSKAPEELQNAMKDDSLKNAGH
jgi:filamentous hemagglutinin family protein